MGQYLSVWDESGIVEKLAVWAFQRYHFHLKRISIDRPPAHLMLFKKRHNTMAFNLNQSHPDIWRDFGPADWDFQFCIWKLCRFLYKNIPDNAIYRAVWDGNFANRSHLTFSEIYRFRSFDISHLRSIDWHFPRVSTIPRSSKTSIFMKFYTISPKNT